MKTLVKKELTEVLVPAACLFVPLTFLWFTAASTRDVLMQPLQEPAAAVLATAGFGGLLIGYCQFHAERWRKTQGYALHRGTGEGRFFLAKVIAGLCATALLAIGPPLVFALWHRLNSPSASILQMQRIVELAWLSAFGISAYALGVLASQLNRAWWKEALFGLVGGAALAVIATLSTIMTPDDPMPHVTRYISIQVAIGLVLLAVGFRLFVRRGDSDLPLPSLPHAVLAPLGIVLFILPLAIGAASLEELRVLGLRSSYPILLRERATGRVLAVVPLERGAYAEVDAEGRLAPGAPTISGSTISWFGRSTDDDAYDELYRPNRGALTGDALLILSGSQMMALNGRWMQMQFTAGASETIAAASEQFIIQGFLDPHAGVVRAFFTEFPYGNRDSVIARPDLVLPRALPMALTLERPEPSGRFSGRAVVIAPPMPRDTSPSAYWERPATYRALCVADLGDRSLWRIDPLDMRAPVSEVTLPDGDRFVRLEQETFSRRLEPASFSVYYSNATLVVAGERGLYVWNGDRFEPFEPAASALTALDAKPSPRAATAYVDPLEPSVEVRGADGSSVLFSYDYAPRGVGARIDLALIYMASLVRSPVASVTSFFSDSPVDVGERDRRIEWFSEPLFHDGHRPLLLLANLALAFHVTRKVMRTLMQRGADKLTIGVWTILTALFGVFGYCLFRLLEPRGSSLGVSEAPASEPAPMLIESRAPAGAQAAGIS